MAERDDLAKLREALVAFPLHKTDWGPGPWLDEPDRVEFRHAGLPCLLNRNRMGTWCGYVAVPPGHALHGKHYNDADVRVHGGLTYADRCSGEICHTPEPGEPDDVRWFGFDCGHGGDFVPALDTMMRERYGGLPNDATFYEGARYRDLAYVRRQTESLAEQLAGVSHRA